MKLNPWLIILLLFILPIVSFFFLKNQSGEKGTWNVAIGLIFLSVLIITLWSWLQNFKDIGKKDSQQSPISSSPLESVSLTSKGSMKTKRKEKEKKKINRFERYDERVKKRILRDWRKIKGEKDKDAEERMRVLAMQLETKKYGETDWLWRLINFLRPRPVWARDILNKVNKEIAGLEKSRMSSKALQKTERMTKPSKRDKQIRENSSNSTTKLGFVKLGLVKSRQKKEIVNDFDKRRKISLIGSWHTHYQFVTDNIKKKISDVKGKGNEETELDAWLERLERKDYDDSKTWSLINKISRRPMEIDDLIKDIEKRRFDVIKQRVNKEDQARRRAQELRELKEKKEIAVPVLAPLVDNSSKSQEANTLLQLPLGGNIDTESQTKDDASAPLDSLK